MVFLMATIFGDVQYSQNGTFTNPCGELKPHMDVGQNGRPLMGPQMWMSSLVLTIQLLGYLILTHTHITP